jgi:hypothetical protein
MLACVSGPAKLLQAFPSRTFTEITIRRLHIPGNI